MKDERVKMKIASKREQRDLVHYAEREQLKACVAGLKLRVSHIQRELVHYAEREQLKACVAGLKMKETICSYTLACRVTVALLPFFAFFIIFAPLNIY